mgnify:FL=1
MFSLCKMDLKRVGTITKMEVNSNIKRRLFDIGIIPGAKISRILEDYKNSISAYAIMDCLIAIRNKDTEGIEVVYDEV